MYISYLHIRVKQFLSNDTDARVCATTNRSLEGAEMFFFLQRYLVVDHYNDVLMSAMASQITSLAIAYSTVYSGADQRKHQSSASLAFVRGIHR